MTINHVLCLQQSFVETSNWNVCWYSLLICLHVRLSVFLSVCLSAVQCEEWIAMMFYAPGSERKILLDFGSNLLRYISTSFAIWDCSLEGHKNSEDQRCTARMHDNITYLSSKAITAITAVID